MARSRRGASVSGQGLFPFCRRAGSASGPGRPIPFGTQLVPEATYPPPGGVLGIVGEVLFERVVARSTADAFIDPLAQTVQRAVAERRCGGWSSTRTSRRAG